MVVKKMSSSPLARREQPNGSRGPSAVLAALAEQERAEFRVKVSEVASNPDNRSGGVLDVEDLVASVTELGVLQAVTVTTSAAFVAAHPEHAESVGAARYVMLGGHRRLAAAQQAGREDLPAILREDLAGRDAEARIAENLMRVEMTPLEEARDYARIIAHHGWSQRELAKRTGVSQGQISKRLSLLTLPERLQQALIADELVVADALVLLEQDADTIAGVAADWDRERSGWEAGINSRIRDAVYEIKRLQREETARAEAAKVGAEFISDATAEFGGADKARLREVTNKATIRKLAKAEDLVVAPADAYSSGGPRFFQKSAPARKEPVRTPAEQERLDAEREWKNARKARRAFAVSFLKSKPSAGDLQQVLVAMTIRGHSMASEVTRLARQWAQEVGVGPADESEDWTWRRVLPQTPASTHAHLAWVITHAVHEGAASSSYTRSWDSWVRQYIDRLIDAGYVLSPVEQARYDAGVKEDATEKQEG